MGEVFTVCNVWNSLVVFSCICIMYVCVYTIHGKQLLTYYIRCRIICLRMINYLIVSYEVYILNIIEYEGG